jgi:hypothetical protein
LFVERIDSVVEQWLFAEEAIENDSQGPDVGLSYEKCNLEAVLAGSDFGGLRVYAPTVGVRFAVLQLLRQPEVS